MEQNNEEHAMEVMIRGMKSSTTFKGCITVFITDGDNLAGPVTYKEPVLLINGRCILR